MRFVWGYDEEHCNDEGEGEDNEKGKEEGNM